MRRSWRRNWPPGVIRVHGFAVFVIPDPRPEHEREPGKPSFKGVAMKHFAMALCATLGVLTSGAMTRADWGSCTYGGQQPWWNVFAHKNHNLTCEEERLQRFWHDYYDALGHYYRALDHIDW